MLGTLHRWMWAGSFEPGMEKLDVLAPEDLTNEDLLAVSSKTIGRLSRTLEDLQEAERRRRHRGVPGRKHEETPEELEVKKIAKSMLPALDALDRIIECGEDAGREDEAFRNWLASVTALRTRLTKTMEGIGLQAISAVGSEVDLEVHDVVGIVGARDSPPNTVVKEQLKGYYFRGKLLRDAKVIVAQ